MKLEVRTMKLEVRTDEKSLKGFHRFVIFRKGKEKYCAKFKYAN